MEFSTNHVPWSINLFFLPNIKKVRKSSAVWLKFVITPALLFQPLHKSLCRHKSLWNSVDCQMLFREQCMQLISFNILCDSDTWQIMRWEWNMNNVNVFFWSSMIVTRISSGLVGKKTTKQFENANLGSGKNLAFCRTKWLCEKIKGWVISNENNL